LAADVDFAPSSTFAIGEWTFSTAANELRRGELRKRLEHRSARALELLCRQRGSIVTQEDLVREVWSGRAISANSVPVVISDLRQALGDDAREPRHIETVSKRGYRLLPQEELTADPQQAEPVDEGKRKRPVWLLAAPALLVVAITLWVVGNGQVAGGPTLIVSAMVNATGSERYRPLASATDAVILADAQKLRGIRVVEGAPGITYPKDAVRLDARLVIWSGRPTVMLSAHDARGAVLWTGMTSGHEDLIPGEVAKALEKLPPALGRARSG
jgi:DNA-binding winged helix-turn-helix (wHTH) protein